MVSLPPSAPLRAAVEALATPRSAAQSGEVPKARAVFILDPETQAPLGVVTPTDLLRILVESGGITASQARAAAA